MVGRPREIADGVHVGAVVPREFVEYLREEAARRGCTVSQVLRDIIRRHYTRPKP